MAFNNEAIEMVWQKATTESGNDPNRFRKDKCGAWILRTEYGNRNSVYGWEIDHINPNGGDYLYNLQPLHWENNVAKSDGVLKCVLVSSGTQNVRR